MAPKAAPPPPETDELVDLPEDPNAPKRAEPAPAIEQEMDADLALDDLTLVEDKEIEITMPLIERARVVYTGNHPHKSVAWRGWVVTESWEIEPAVPEVKNAKGVVVQAAKPAVMEFMKTPTGEGNITSYDFALRDARGRIITARRMPSTTHPRVANKIFTICEHPEHLRLFKRMRDGAGQPEFEVMIPMARRPAWDNYVADVERKIGRHNTLADYAQGLRDTPE